MLAGFVAINSGSTGNTCSHNFQTMPGKESIMNTVNQFFSHLSALTQIFTYFHVTHSEETRGIVNNLNNKLHICLVWSISRYLLTFKLWWWKDSGWAIHFYDILIIYIRLHVKDLQNFFWHVSNEVWLHSDEIDGCPSVLATSCLKSLIFL